MAFDLQDVVQRRVMIADSDTPDTQKRLDRERLDAMAGFAESPICRRAVLLGYFGEEHPGSCGKCDRLLAPVAGVDGTTLEERRVGNEGVSTCRSRWQPVH